MQRDLLKDFGKVREKEKEVMEFIEANISHLGALEAVYLTSRYIPVEFEKFEVESLLNFAKKMREFLDELCSKRA
ncbi:MAG: HEPN domain-containing protein [Archaeoglobaceae archaeon]